ncbi:MAG TPA: hypothetical protein ENI23_16805 [bacterium]|nr:hypothetical protein [bacterium]
MSLVVKDSGKRRVFNSGGARDAEEGKGRFDLLLPMMLTRLSKLYESGAIKYDARNWEKGIPSSSFLDSAKRHLNKHHEGRRDEDHLAAVLFNVCGVMFNEIMISRTLLPPELNDLPNYFPEKCPVHKKYKVEKKPRSDCPYCLIIWNKKVYYEEIEF